MHLLSHDYIGNQMLLQKWRLIVVASMSAFTFSNAVNAGVYAAPIQNAAAWLESSQDASDGSWLDISEVRTFLQTAEAVLALNQANRRLPAYYAGQTWIENHDPKNIDARARRLLVLRANQSSAQKDIDALLAAVSTPVTGQIGWALSKDYHASPLDTALALDALHTVGASFNSSQAIAYLKATQFSASGNQGWPSGANTDGTYSADAYTTARVVQALAGYKTTDSTLATPIANAIATLKTKVTTSSPPHVRAATALAYLRVDPNSADAKALLNSLVSMQRADGGFDAGIFTAGVIVQAFAEAEGKDTVANLTRVDIPDAALRRAINQALGRSSMAQLNQGELANLTYLDISGLGVTSLSGLQYATNLTTLLASNNAIADASPIAGLTGLTQKDLSGNPCAGCSGGTAVASSGDVPLPFWALAALGAGLMGIAGRTQRRRGND